MHFYYVGLNTENHLYMCFYLWKSSESFEMSTYLTQMYMHFHALSKLLFPRAMHSGVLVNI